MDDLSLCFMPEERRCHLINSGAFNDIIAGYVVLAAAIAENEGISIERGIYRAFDDFTAEEALTELRG